MDDVLDILIRVQSFDDEIKENNLKLEEIPNKITRLEQEIAKTESDLTQKKNRIQEIKKTYKIKEGDIAENEEKMNKLNQQVFSVKTNEEYRAILNEVDYLKKTNKKIEDEMIRLLEEDEELKITIDRLTKETEEFVDKKTKEIANLRKEKEELSAKLLLIKSLFEDNLRKLPEDVKNIYQRTTNARGKAVCLITDNTCTGCYSNLTPQFINELKKRDKILLCDSCGRILIYATK